MKGIYISNLSEATSEDDLLRHFANFGDVTSCIVFRFKDGRCKGFAKITVQDAETYNCIMSYDRGHVILGREANLEPFIENREIVEQRNFDLEQRKICVLGLPKKFREGDLHQLFEFFGEVERAYLREDAYKDDNFGFVIFKKIESTRSAIRQGQLFIRESGTSVRIKKFRSNRGYKAYKYLKKSKFNSASNYQKVSSSKNKVHGSQKFDQKHRKNPRIGKNSDTNDFGYVKKSEIPKNDELLDHFFQNDKNVSLEKVINELKIKFMPSNRLKEYMKKIITQNQDIRWISPNHIQKLELFFFNKIRGNDEILLAKSILKNLAIKIDSNHEHDNIRIPCGNGRQYICWNCQ